MMDEYEERERDELAAMERYELVDALRWVASHLSREELATAPPSVACVLGEQGLL